MVCSKGTKCAVFTLLYLLPDLNDVLEKRDVVSKYVAKLCLFPLVIFSHWQRCEHSLSHRVLFCLEHAHTSFLLECGW